MSALERALISAVKLFVSVVSPAILALISLVTFVLVVAKFVLSVVIDALAVFTLVCNTLSPAVRAAIFSR